MPLSRAFCPSMLDSYEADCDLNERELDTGLLEKSRAIRCQAFWQVTACEGRSRHKASCTRSSRCRASRGCPSNSCSG